MAEDITLLSESAVEASGLVTKTGGESVNTTCLLGEDPLLVLLVLLDKYLGCLNANGDGQPPPEVEEEKLYDLFSILSLGDAELDRRLCSNIDSAGGGGGFIILRSGC